ncbi:hypothetical protein KJ612_01815 [Myxococcota bacterium]|nr:hypothetical protein [Myxococcota bacterium]MBU1411337.1 hypothetical protein [Myxococcota bacterium]
MKHILLTILLLELAACDLVGGDGAWCGNGVLERGEDCDGRQIAPVLPATCVEAGYHAGTPRCSNCQLDFHPCVPSGRCGDGVLQPAYEECDGREFGGVTCESLGNYAGTLECSRDCRIVESACKRCGDGVLQPGFGERVEVSLETCMDEGFFGGVATTTDCQTPSTEFCGNYRLLTEGSSLLAPVFTGDASGEILIAGVVQGALPGFTHPGCPDLMDFYYYGPSPEDPDEWIESFGGYMYPSCRDHFFASLTAVPGLQTHYQKDFAVNITDMVDLGDRGLAFLRSPESGGNLLDLVDRDGASRFLLELEYYPTQSATPPVQRISEDQIAIVTTPSPDTWIQIRRFSLSGNRILDTITLDSIKLHDVEYRWGEFIVFHTFWRPDGNPFFLMNLKKDSSEDTATYLVETTIQDDHLIVDSVVPLHVWIHYAPGSTLLPDGNSVEVGWFEYAQYEPIVMHIDRWTLSGARTATAELTLPEGYQPHAAARTPEGNWLVAGTTVLTERTPGMPVTCDDTGDDEYKKHLFAFLVSPDGTILERQHFYSGAFLEAAFSGNISETVCNISRQYFHVSQNTVLVGGAWDRSRFFCTPDEPVTRVQLDPLHACGIWLVKMEFTP